jgi:hypothetical protein
VLWNTKQWRALRGYPVVWPDPLFWREDDPTWGAEAPARKAWSMK